MLLTQFHHNFLQVRCTKRGSAAQRKSTPPRFIIGQIAFTLAIQVSTEKSIAAPEAPTHRAKENALKNTRQRQRIRHQIYAQESITASPIAGKATVAKIPGKTTGNFQIQREPRSSQGIQWTEGWRPQTRADFTEEQRRQKRKRWREENGSKKIAITVVGEENSRKA